VGRWEIGAYNPYTRAAPPLQMVRLDLADVLACLTERRGRITFGMSLDGWGSRIRRVTLTLEIQVDRRLTLLRRSSHSAERMP
jgi:hypothetical protein